MAKTNHHRKGNMEKQIYSLRLTEQVHQGESKFSLAKTNSQQIPQSKYKLE